MSTLPLTRHRQPGDAVLVGPAGMVDAASFFAQARRLAHALPQGTHVINLCESRHGFMLGFAAALMRGQVSLLPPGRGRGDWEALPARYGGAYVLSEAAVAGAHSFALEEFLGERAGAALDVPLIDARAIATILFTSGSTGEPAAHPKSWGQLCRGAHGLARALGWDERVDHAIVGSVPPQHMFGLEATVMLPWQSGCAVHGRVPLLPADLETALAQCEGPAWWMATPMHLRARLQAVPTARLRGVVASTMSLPQPLAAAAEAAWHAPVMEVYGSTETGAIATRRTAVEEAYTPLAGVTLHAHGEAESTRVRVQGPHIDVPVELGDVLELHADGRFHWLGRAADLVKVGGKRASLAALNLALVEIPGVSDGVFAFAPEAVAAQDESHPARRLAAFFVSGSLEAREVLAALRARIDPAFLPRPLHRVPALPRNANGKLTQSAVAGLFAQCQESQAFPAAHPALPGHFPGDPVVPGAVLLARVADTLRARFAPRVPGELLHARFHRPLRPGEPFAIDATLTGGRVRFEVRRAQGAANAGAPIAGGEWLLVHDESRTRD